MKVLVARTARELGDGRTGYKVHLAFSHHVFEVMWKLVQR